MISYQGQSGGVSKVIVTRYEICLWCDKVD